MKFTKLIYDHRKHLRIILCRVARAEQFTCKQKSVFLYRVFIMLDLQAINDYLIVNLRKINC